VGSPVWNSNSLEFYGPSDEDHLTWVVVCGLGGGLAREGGKNAPQDSDREWG